MTERLRFVISRFLGRQGVWKSPGPEFPYEKVKVFLSGLNHGFGLLMVLRTKCHLTVKLSFSL